MPVKVRVPQLTQTMTEAEIVRWLKAEGEEVKAGEPLLEVVTDKATVDVESPYAGVLGKIFVSEGIAPVGKVICLLLAEGEQVVEGSVAKESASGSAVPAGRVRISPLAKRLAAENSVDIRRLTPSGPGGLILDKDVKAYLASAIVSGSAGISPVLPPVAERAALPASVVVSL